MILRKAHVGKEGSEPSSHIHTGPGASDSGVIYDPKQFRRRPHPTLPWWFWPFTLLLALTLVTPSPFSKDDWEKYSGPSQTEHVTPWKAQAEKAKAKDRDEAQCRAVAPHVADHTGKSTDMAMAECMKRRAQERP